MKVTDYGPRISTFDTYIKTPGTTGAEIGCDVGAHAEALLKYCGVKMLYLVDVWDREYYRGYCEGRLFSQGYRNNVELIQGTSKHASEKFLVNSLDFVYIDITHDYDTVLNSLVEWFNKVKPGGIIGYRNYHEKNIELKRAVDYFTKSWSKNISNIIIEPLHAEIIITVK